MSEQGKEPELDIADKIKIAIEQCLIQYMTKQECLNFVYEKFGFHPPAVECVWWRLRSENPEFFNAYYRRILLMKQIVKFNHLLSQQVEFIRASSYNGSHPSSSGQYIPSPSALPTANTHYDYAQVCPNLLMSQHGNESMFHPSSCCCTAAPGSLFHPSTGVPNSYTQVSPNTVLPHNQNGSLFQPSAEVASNDYAQYTPNMSISPDTNGSLIRPSMAGACNGYVLAPHNQNISLVHPSFNDNMVLNSHLGTERSVYDDGRSTLKFIPTPQARDATTSTSLLPSGSGDSPFEFERQRFIHGDRLGHPLASSRTRKDREADSETRNTRARGEANNFTNGDLNTPGSSTGSVD